MKGQAMSEKYSCAIETPLGGLLVKAEDGKLTELRFSDEFSEASSLNEVEPPLFRSVREWLSSYFAGEDPKADIPLNPGGTPFRREVWNMLLEIPHGELVSYGELAKEYSVRHGGKMSAQAVGGAVGSNPISIIIPCHRVIGTGGNLTGYGGGLLRKLRLLELEGVSTAKLFFPKSEIGRARR